jgi:hypothetical protein
MWLISFGCFAAIPQLDTLWMISIGYDNYSHWMIMMDDYDGWWTMDDGRWIVMKDEGWMMDDGPQFKLVDDRQTIYLPPLSVEARMKKKRSKVFEGCCETRGTKRTIQVPRTKHQVPVLPVSYCGPPDRNTGTQQTGRTTTNSSSTSTRITHDTVLYSTTYTL